MADEIRQEPGSITKTADAQNERISGISNVSNTITQMQKTTQRQIEETDESIKYGQAPEASAEQMNGILSRFGKTITAFTKGVENVTISSARATKDAIGQYGKAIGQDISFNKQNMVAMALSRTTPLFGYFAAKFMETDVFQKAKERMKESISGVFKSVGSSIANIFKGKEKAHEESVPKMQRGGYVERGGMVEVHPAEVVMPIEKILSRIDDSISAGREIAEITSKTQMRSLAKMSRFVEADRNKEPVGMTKGFLRAMREVQTQYEEPSNIRLLRAVLSIQDTMGATIGTWEQIWTKMLVEHPTFRQVAFAMKTVGSVLGAPYKILWRIFKRRGGYIGHLSRSRNPFESMGSNIGILYTGTMWRLDNIALYTKATAVILRDLAFHLTQGRLRYPKIESVGEGTRSIFGWARFGMHNLLKWGPRIVAGGIDIMLGGKGTGMAFPMAKKFGDWITRRIEWGETVKGWLKSKRRKAQEFALEGGGGFEALIKAQQNNKIPPLLVMSKAAEEAAIYDQKTSDSVEEVAKITKRKWIWEKVQAAKGGIKSVLSWLWGILMMGGGFIKKLLGLGTGGWLTGALGGLFKGLFKAGGPILGALAGLFAKGGVIATALSSAWLWGPIGAAIVGAGIGTAINKWLIQPWVTHFSDKWREEESKAAAATNKQLLENVKAAKGLTEVGMKSYEGAVAAQVKGSLTSAERTSQLSGFIMGGPDKKIKQITRGQEEFIQKNIGEYSKFDPDLMRSYRKQWLDTEGGATFGLGRFFWQDPVKYGERRESAFFRWLKRKAEVVDPQAMASKHEKALLKSKSVTGKVDYMARKYGPEAKQWLAESGSYAINQAGELVDKVTGRIITAKDIAQMKAGELLATSKLLGQELKQRGMEQLKGMEGLGDQISQNMNSVSNMIQQQVRQVTSIYNSGQGKSSAMDEMNQRIATGNFH